VCVGGRGEGRGGGVGGRGEGWAEALVGRRAEERAGPALRGRARGRLARVWALARALGCGPRGRTVDVTSECPGAHGPPRAGGRAARGVPTQRAPPGSEIRK